MYNPDSSKKIYYLLSDIIANLLTYVLLAIFYHYSFFESSYFLIIFITLIVVSSVFMDEYTYITRRGYLKELKSSIIYGLKCIIFFSFVLSLGKFRFLSDIAVLSYFFLLLFFLLNSLLVYTGRIMLKSIMRGREDKIKKILLLTNFTDNKSFEKALLQHHYQVVGYISSKVVDYRVVPVLRNVSDIRNFIANNQVDEIFVDIDAYSDYIEAARYFKLLGIPTTINITNYNNYYIDNSILKKIGNMSFVTTAINIVSFRQLFLKRIIDIFIAVIGIFITGIVALLIFPIIKIQSPGPLFFTQKRVGKNGKVFEIYKFRSMYIDAEQRKKELLSKNNLNTNLMFKMENDPRIFPFGQKIRNWSIDELPQFLNVLKGDMSVVGTRPPTLEEYKQYELHHFKRLAAKPGITGLWQVSGRSAITDFEEVVSLDMKYIQNWSLSEDIKIIVRTFVVVFKKEGSR